MKIARIILITAVMFMASISSLMAAKAAVTVGKSLHDKSCVKCHTTSVYSRKDRKVLSMPMLKARIKHCYRVTGAKWTDKQRGAVVEYLNTTFYKFSTK